MDTIKYEILEDGTITTETDKVSGKNHQSADDLLEQLSTMLGGHVSVQQKQGHQHVHTHSHSHGGIHHTH